MNVHNRHYLKDRRKSLRNRTTSAEAVLWRSLKNSQLNGRKFRRQHSIGRYVVDFYCPSEKLIIELDGEPHFSLEGMIHDQKRDLYLGELGITVLRFENFVVFERLDQLLSDIRAHFKNG